MNKLLPILLMVGCAHTLPPVLDVRILDVKMARERPREEEVVPYVGVYKVGFTRPPNITRAILGQPISPAVQYQPVTFANDLYLIHQGITGTDCHFDVNVDNNWLYVDCGVRFTANLFLDTGVVGSAGAMTFNPATTIAFHGSNFDVTTAGVVTTTGAISSGGNLTARSASFTQFSVGTVGNAYLNVDSNGITTSIFGTVNAVGNVQQVLNLNVTAVGNVGASGPDDLQTYPLPAGTFNATWGARCVRASWKGNTANNANAKTIRIAAGATPTALVTKQFPINAVVSWEAELVLCRTGSNTQSYYAKIHQNQGTALNPTDGTTIEGESAFGTLTETEANALNMKVQSTVSTSDNDISSKLLFVEAL